MSDRTVFVPITEHYTRMVEIDLDEAWDEDETPTWEEIVKYVDDAEPHERIPRITSPAWAESIVEGWCGVPDDLSGWALGELLHMDPDARRWLGRRIFSVLAGAAAGADR